MPAPVTLTIISDASTRTEIAEALAHCNAQARRCLAFDHLGRPNPQWAKLHRSLDSLLEQWMRAD